MLPDDDGPPGFCRATPESLAQWRTEALAEFASEVEKFFRIDCGLAGDELKAKTAEAVRRVTAIYDERSAPFTRKVLAKYVQDGGAIH